MYSTFNINEVSNESGDSPKEKNYCDLMLVLSVLPESQSTPQNSKLSLLNRKYLKLVISLSNLNGSPLLWLPFAAHSH